MSDRTFLKPDEIEYIALEGGGGKGFAYLGAIDALNEIEGFSFDNIKGYSGASAGAITAMLLSIGITTKEGITEFMEKISSDIFFDIQNFDKIPYPYEYKPSPTVKELKKLYKSTGATKLLEILRSWFVILFVAYLFSSSGMKKFNDSLNKLFQLIYNIALDIFLQIRNNIIFAFKYFIRKVIIDKLKKYLPFKYIPGALQSIEALFDSILIDGTDTDTRYFEDVSFVSNKAIEEFDSQVTSALIKFIKTTLNLEDKILKFLAYQNWGTVYVRDKGLTPALEARNLFDETIASSLKISRRSITFKELWDLTDKNKRKKLLVTGTNLTIGRTIVFSVDETPNFPVADAVRISMSLPFIFKPYEITEEKEGWPPLGVYIDGGVWNNLPMRLFDGEIESKREQANKFSYSIKPGNTLAIKLALDPRNEVTNIFSMLKILTYDYGLMGSGETQIYRNDFWRTIFLDTKPLETLGFNKPEEKIEKLINKRSRRTVYRYFSLAPKPDDLDDDDDKELEARKSLSIYSKL